MNTTNPYEAPRAAVADPVLALDAGDLLDRPRAVSAGNGWQWIVSAWELFKASPLTWLALLFLFFGANLALNFVPFVGGLAANMLFPFVIATVGFIADGVRRGYGADLGAALSKLQPPAGGLAILGLFYLLAVFVMVIAAIIPLAAMGGFQLFAHDGGGTPKGAMFAVVFLVVFAVSVPTMMAFYFSPYLVALHGKAPMEAIKLSFAACLRNLLPGIVMLLASMVLGVVACLPLFLGWFVLAPVLMIVSYAAYRDLFFEG